MIQVPAIRSESALGGGGGGGGGGGLYSSPVLLKTEALEFRPQIELVDLAFEMRATASVRAVIGVARNLVTEHQHADPAPLRIALSHHCGPRRLISFSRLGTGMMP